MTTIKQVQARAGLERTGLNARRRGCRTHPVSRLARVSGLDRYVELYNLKSRINRPAYQRVFILPAARSRCRKSPGLMIASPWKDVPSRSLNSRRSSVRSTFALAKRAVDFRERRLPVLAGAARDSALELYTHFCTAHYWRAASFTVSSRRSPPDGQARQARARVLGPWSGAWGRASGVLPSRSPACAAPVPTSKPLARALQRKRPPLGQS